MRRVVKFLHTLGAAGVTGALIVQIALIMNAPATDDAFAFATHRQAMAFNADWVLLPGLALVLISGLLAVIVHRPFTLLGWVWFKAALGIAMFEGTLIGVIGPATQAAALARRVADGELNSSVLHDVLMHEWGAICVVLFVALLQTAVGIWRPSPGRARG